MSLPNCRCRCHATDASGIDAVTTWGVPVNDPVEAVKACPMCLNAHSAALSTRAVHNHGPDEGRGLHCREHLVDGHLTGECMESHLPPTPWTPKQADDGEGAE